MAESGRKGEGRLDWHKDNVFYTVFERMLGNGRQEKKKYAAVYDNIITYNKCHPSARSGAIRLTAREVAEPSSWQLRGQQWKMSHIYLSLLLRT